MKYFGSQSEHHADRSADLLRAYFTYIDRCKHVSMPDVFQHVVRMSASRFWVSAPRAAIVVSSIIRGDKLSYMRPNKREMFLEIHRRVILLQKAHPDWSLQKLVAEVASQPAPRFYISPASARVIILKARKKWFKDRASARKLP